MEDLNISRIGQGSSLQEKEAVLVNIIEEEMAHQTWVLVLSQLNLQQAKEIKAQSKEIKYFSTLLNKQQTIPEKVWEQQSSVSQMPQPHPPPLQLEELHRETCEICPRK